MSGWDMPDRGLRGTLWAVFLACASAFVSKTWGARSRLANEAPSFNRKNALVVYRDAVS